MDRSKLVLAPEARNLRRQTLRNFSLTWIRHKLNHLTKWLWQDKIVDSCQKQLTTWGTWLEKRQFMIGVPHVPQDVKGRGIRSLRATWKGGDEIVFSYHLELGISPNKRHEKDPKTDILGFLSHSRAITGHQPVFTAWVLASSPAQPWRTREVAAIVQRTVPASPVLI